MHDNMDGFPFDHSILSTAVYKKRVRFLDSVLLSLPTSLIITSWGFLLEPVALYMCSKILGCEIERSFMKKAVHQGLFSISSEQISVQDARQLIDFFSKSTVGNRVALIKDPEKMTHNASNALLKTIEEPPSNSFVIFFTNRINALSDTLRSRCVELEILAFTRGEFKEILEFLTASSKKASRIICDLLYPNAELAIKILNNLGSSFVEENLSNIQDLLPVIRSIFTKAVDLSNNEKIAILFAVLCKTHMTSVSIRKIDNLYKAREILLDCDRFNLDLESALNYIISKVSL
ncbi:DNA polymerase III subunit delta' [Candidatus Cyrtobacter comes]|uniref:DNA polymerase III subunit delta n=2 Tax=Candidatus Cyrtobacter comes TaxID=675776 RepID=A0ABU5L7E4_9RICK|nr:DNA polymerase III subunit delta' [Candidatus Cyrtobacter comes]